MTGVLKFPNYRWLSHPGGTRSIGWGEEVALAEVVRVQEWIFYQSAVLMTGLQL